MYQFFNLSPLSVRSSSRKSCSHIIGRWSRWPVTQLTWAWCIQCMFLHTVNVNLFPPQAAIVIYMYICMCVLYGSYTLACSDMFIFTSAGSRNNVGKVFYSSLFSSPFASCKACYTAVAVYLRLVRLMSSQTGFGARLLIVTDTFFALDLIPLFLQRRAFEQFHLNNILNYVSFMFTWLSLLHSV